jgi:pimeloyl-ACP methyl ester carboxylesterase
MSFPEARRIELSSGIGMSVHEQGEGPAVVLCHGFPELAYSWRHQMQPIADAGFRVIAPDMRGYGATDRPESIDAYDLASLCGDLVALLDALNIGKAVFAGHDWGGFVAWGMPVLHPDRTAGVIGVNTPYVPFPHPDMLRMISGGDDDRIYILWFQEPGKADPILHRDTRLMFEKIFIPGMDPAQAAARMMESGELDMNPFRRLPELEQFGECILDPEELEHFVATFERTGFTGGINWYRNIARNHKEHPGVGTQKLDLPCLMVTAEWDPALSPALAANMPNLCSDLEMKMIETCGHFTQQERPEELSALMVDWLVRRRGDLS